MIKQIKCDECGEILGTIEKETITDQDEALIRQTTVCSLGHGQVVLIHEEET